MIRTTTIQRIDVSDWDTLVQTTYGRVYNLQQQDGCQDRGTLDIAVPVAAPEDFENDTIPDEVNGTEMGVSFASWLARDPEEWNGSEEKKPWTLGLFWSRNFYPSIDMVINDLHVKGLLPAGHYVIDIDW